MAEQTLETMSGKVSQINEWGVQLDGRGDTWLNFSKYPKGPMDMPERGDSVKLGVTKDKNGKWWIGSCEIQHSASEDGADPFAPASPPSERDIGMRRGNALNVAGVVISAFVAHGHYDTEEFPVDAAFIDLLAHAQEVERSSS